MTKEELFTKYEINESHNVWDTRIDNWMSVEVYRIMHNGELPDQNAEPEYKYITDFLDKHKTDLKWWVENVMCRRDWGSLFLTAKRMVYSLHEGILNEINK